MLDYWPTFGAVTNLMDKREMKTNIRTNAPTNGPTDEHNISSQCMYNETSDNQFATMVFPSEEKETTV